MNRPLHVIAREIQQDWGPKINYAARPYLNAMRSLSHPSDSYGYDSGKSVVLYFLANAGTWRGETARRVKAELRELCGA
jgi:hypothetical protein